MRGWYVKTFGATAGRRGDFETAVLPGVILAFARSADAVIASTKDRAVDHIGFEVRDLQAFASRLEGAGITLDRRYARAPAMNNLGTVTFTDPWGTVIELTEGLDRIR